MRAPLSWIREFTPVEAPPGEVAHTLSFLGLVVEGMEVTGAPLPGIVVARVLATRPHPAADRIQLVDVDTGDGEALQICCGAFNMKPGDLVPLATIGTVMPSGMEIGRRKLRGEWSNGMLCSAPELNLGPEGPEPAILVLASGSAEPGQAAAEALGLAADVIFDLDISPNRSDCFSIAGIARDLSAAFGLEFSLPEPPHRADSEVASANVAVSGPAAVACPRFTGTVIESVELAQVSPVVRHRLVLAGMRAINPVVDVSNYVMLELGQPNHPYDIEKLGGHGLVVRWAGQGEQIVTLDGTVRRLCPEDLVIADGEGKTVGVAGIMGGASAEISQTTRTVLLEAANFAPHVVSATGRRLSLLSEARTRFERGVDIELATLAVDRFVELLGPAVRPGRTTDVRAPLPPEPPVRLRTERANLVLGTSLTPGECAELLGRLGFRATPAADGGAAPGEQVQGAYDVEVPTWRPDCRREVDLIEEIARVHGYDRIPRSLPPRPLKATGLTRYQRQRRRAREALKAAGLDEAWTTSFLSPQELSGTGSSHARAIELENPLDQSQALLRTSVLPGLLRAARFNFERQAAAVRLFEIGHVFERPSGAGPPGPVEGVHEWEQLGIVAAGPGTDMNYAVRAWEVLFRALHLGSRPAAALAPPAAAAGLSTAAAGGPPGLGEALHPGRRADLVISGERAGALGELSPQLAARWGLPGAVAVVLVDLGVLLGAPERALVAEPVSRYPAADLDMAFVVSDEVVAGQLCETLEQAAGELAESVVLFDIWRDGSLGQGKRSLAFRARLRSMDRTLTDEEVSAVRERAATAALEAHGAVLRRN